MITSAVPFLLPVLLAAGSDPSVQLPEGERTATLARRAERPADDAPAERPAFQGAGPGNLLFSMTAVDNAVCVRSVSDVTGDGLDEVVVGIDESQVDNVFCLDGSSSGTATVVWSLETMDGVSGGSPFGDQCLTPISDADGNGNPNVLLGTATGGRTAYSLDALDGSIHWRLDTYLEVDSGWVYSLCELNDHDGDGVPEVAFGAGSDNDRVYLVDGASGDPATVRWRWFAGDAVLSVRDLGDVNGDGDHDVLVAISDDVDQIVCLDGGTTNPLGSVEWTYTPGTTVFACGVLPDVTGDGIDEALAVLWTTTGSAIRCLNGATGGVVWSSTAVTDFGVMVDVIQDVNGDDVDDVVVSSWENAVIVLDGDDGSLVWKTTVGTLNGGDVWTARAIGDLNGDGEQDVIAGSFDYHVYALDGTDGTVFWAYDTGNRVFSVHPVGDLNGDGRPEVAVGTQDTTNSTVVHVLEGDAGIDPPFLAYCTGKITTQGCVPFLDAAGAGVPSVSDTNPFLVRGNDFTPGNGGVLVYGYGKSNLGFHGGKLCVKSPIRTAGKAAKSVAAVSCTTATTTGRLVNNFNNRIQVGPDPQLTAGQTVFAQWQQRDPGNTIGGFADALSNGLRFTVGP